MHPTLPDNAPFTPEQRGWLNGFLAGLFSGEAAPGCAVAPPAAAAPPPIPERGPVTLLWGSQTGNAEGLARKTAKKLGPEGFEVTVHDLASYPVENLPGEESLLIITSTYGDGEPPDNAADFHAHLLSEQAPKFDGTRFAVFALGDSEYPDFCECGKQFDQRLEELGATRLAPRVDADVDFDEPFAAWIDTLVEQLAAPVA